jgi:ABC-type transport system involved in cytochrome bd biosynthesis fused ATPase/permease subunit
MAVLKNKTVILVTHQVEFLSKVDKILVSNFVTIDYYLEITG